MKLPVRRPKTKPQRNRQRRAANWQSPTAFSYHAQRAERADTPNRQQLSTIQQRSQLLSPRFWLRRSGLIVISIVALICLISIVSLSTTPRVELANASSGTNFRLPSEYAAAISHDLSSSILNHNKLTVDTNGVSRQLQQQFPELSQVTVALPLVGHRPIFYLTTNSPAFIFQSASGTYILDSSGTVLVTKAMASQKLVAELPIITDQTGLAVHVGQGVISANNADFIKTVLANLSAKHIAVAALVLPASTAQELDVHLSGQPYYIKFNMHDSGGAQQEAGTYLATINNLATQHITPTSYIDVRVPGRAYYM